METLNLAVVQKIKVKAQQYHEPLRITHSMDMLEDGTIEETWRLVLLRRDMVLVSKGSALGLITQLMQVY